MNLLIMAGLASGLLVVLGALIGHSLAEGSLEMRARRQAALQRQLNEQAQRLRLAASLGAGTGEHTSDPAASVAYPQRSDHRAGGSIAQEEDRSAVM